MTPPDPIAFWDGKCLDCAHPEHEMTCHEYVPNGDPSNGPAYCPCADSIESMEQEIVRLRAERAALAAEAADTSGLRADVDTLDTILFEHLHGVHSPDGSWMLCRWRACLRSRAALARIRAALAAGATERPYSEAERQAGDTGIYPDVAGGVYLSDTAYEALTARLDPARVASILFGLVDDETFERVMDARLSPATATPEGHGD